MSPNMHITLRIAIISNWSDLSAVILPFLFIVTLLVKCEINEQKQKKNSISTK